MKTLLKRSVTTKQLIATTVAAIAIATGLTMTGGNAAVSAEVPLTQTPPMAGALATASWATQPAEPEVILSEMDQLLLHYGYSHQASLDAIAQRQETGARQISADGLDLIKFFEGYSATGYLLGDGRCTIGWGHTVPEEELPGAQCEAWEITEAEAAEYLLGHIEFYEASVDGYFTRELTQHQFDALVSFAYNVGEAYLKYDWPKNADDAYFNRVMMMYVNPPQFREGLTIRRTAEVELLNAPEGEAPIRQIIEKLAVQRFEREQRLAAEAAAATNA